MDQKISQVQSITREGGGKESKGLFEVGVQGVCGKAWTEPITSSSTADVDLGRFCVGFKYLSRPQRCTDTCTQERRRFNGGPCLGWQGVGRGGGVGRHTRMHSGQYVEAAEWAPPDLVLRGYSGQ
jgi:hypothetical protein